MEEKDIRWEQRFANYKKALAKLAEGISAVQELDKSGSSFIDIVREGVIQRFEFTHELGWNLLKDYLEFQGTTGIFGSRDATRMAFERGLIEDGEAWMDMIKSRNLSSHVYDEAVAGEIFRKITDRYFGPFQKLVVQMATFQIETR